MRSGGQVFDLVKRDDLLRFREWLDLQRFSVSANDNSPEYRNGWNDCLAHVQRHLSR